MSILIAYFQNLFCTFFSHLKVMKFSPRGNSNFSVYAVGRMGICGLSRN